MDTAEEKKDDVISFDDFLKVDIRVGTIVVAEKVEKSKKLLRLDVDFGEELGRRQILAGIAETYADPALLKGVPAAFVVNLAPRKMMGLESHGMILALAAKESGVALVHPSRDVANGTRLG